MLALLWIEIRRSQGFWLLPLMVGLGIAITWGQDYEDVVRWPNLSESIMQSYVIVGPLAAALAAWLVDRDRRRRVEGLVGTMPTSPFRRDAVLLATAAFWGLAGYAIVAGWHGVQGVREATWGGPNLALIATGALAIVILTGSGIIVGRLVRGKFCPIVAVAAAFFLSAAPEFVQTWIDDSGVEPRLSFRPLTPWGLVEDQLFDIFFRFPSGYLAAALTWLVGAAAITIVAIALMRHWRGNWTAWIALVLACAVAVVGANRVMGYDADPGLEEDLRVPFTWSCTTMDQLEVCAHPSYEVTLDESARQISDFLAPIAGLPGVPARWEQQSPFGGAPDGIGTFQPGQLDFFAGEVGNAVFAARGDWSGFNAAQIVILTWLSGRVEPDTRQFGMFDYPSELQMTPVINDYGMMMGMSVDPDAEAYFAREIPAATDRFAALAPEAQRAWLESNWDALRTGDLILEDLP